MVIDSIWVVAVFGGLAVLALVASRIVRRREIKRRQAEAVALTSRPQRSWRVEGESGDRDPNEVPSQRERAEQRAEQGNEQGSEQYGDPRTRDS